MRCLQWLTIAGVLAIIIALAALAIAARDIYLASLQSSPAPPTPIINPVECAEMGMMRLGGDCSSLFGEQYKALWQSGGMA